MPLIKAVNPAIAYETITKMKKGETMNNYKIAVTHDGLHAKPVVAGGIFAWSNKE